jgi:hypothetical protein
MSLYLPEKFGPKKEIKSSQYCAALMNLYPDSSNFALMSCLVIAKGSNSTITVFVILFISIFLIPFLSFNCFSMIGLHVVQYIPTTL